MNAMCGAECPDCQHCCANILYALEDVDTGEVLGWRLHCMKCEAVWEEPK